MESLKHGRFLIEKVEKIAKDNHIRGVIVDIMIGTLVSSSYVITKVARAVDMKTTNIAKQDIEVSEIM